MTTLTWLRQHSPGAYVILLQNHPGEVDRSGSHKLRSRATEVFNMLR